MGTNRIMQLYRIMPTNTRAMPLACSPQVFVNEYFKCWQDPNRATDFLYELIQPFLKHWERMLREHSYQKDLNYIALCRRLYPIANDPQTLLQKYVEHADQVSSVQEELEILFFIRLRSLRYYPKKAAPRMAEYVIAKFFRDRLKDKITHSRNHPIDIPVPELIFKLLATEDVHPDHLLLKNLGLDRWESYLLELLKLGMNTMEISALTHLPRKTFANEGNHIWHKLKEKWQAT
ncbi:MAG TPA: hypothetical protein DF712_01240 [Balneola sp.]|nr:hypothetical protein [Balneola sp.]